MSGTSETPEIPATERFLWQLCKTYALEFPDSLRPVRSELVAAFVPRAVRLLVVRRVAPDVMRGLEAALEVMPERRTEMAAEISNVLRSYIHDLVFQIVELDSWMHEPGVNEVECGNWLTANGYQFQEVSELLMRGKRYQPGRRPTKRLFTVAALEAQRLDPSRSWRKLLDDFCDCEKFEHDDGCREALRKSAAQLESTLEKYRKLPVPAELVAPLANIFLDQLRWRHSS